MENVVFVLLSIVLGALARRDAMTGSFEKLLELKPRLSSAFVARVLFYAGLGFLLYAAAVGMSVLEGKPLALASGLAAVGVAAAVLSYTFWRKP